MGSQGTVPPTLPSVSSGPGVRQRTSSVAHTQTTAAMRGGPVVSHTAGNYLHGLVGGGVVSDTRTQVSSSSAPASMGHSYG